MFAKVLSYSLVFSILSLVSFDPAYAASEESREKGFLINKMKAAVAKLGTGEKARVEVKIKDGTSVKGYIKGASDDSFVLIDSKTNQTITIQYSQVQDIKETRSGKGLKIGLIVIGVALGITLIIKSRSD